jgi:hypothetical protein
VPARVALNSESRSKRDRHHVETDREAGLIPREAVEMRMAETRNDPFTRSPNLNFSHSVSHRTRSPSTHHVFPLCMTTA